MKRFEVTVDTAIQMIDPIRAAVEDPAVEHVEILVGEPIEELMGALAWRPSGPWRFLGGLCSNPKSVVKRVQPEPEKPTQMYLLVGSFISDIVTRASEMIECLENNLRNPAIREVHLFVEDPVEQWEAWLETFDFPAIHLLRKLIGDPRLKLIRFGRRPFYGEYFEYANRTFPPGSLVMISNSDIEYDRTLLRLGSHDLTNVFISLTRESGHEGHSGTSDTWIFVVPAHKGLLECRWPLGINGGELKIAYAGETSGYETINPCFSIHTIHRHDGVSHYAKTWPKAPRIKGPYANPFPTGLEALNSKRRNAAR